MKPTTSFVLIKTNTYSDRNYQNIIEKNLTELQKRIHIFEKVKISNFTFTVELNKIIITKNFIKGKSFEKITFNQKLMLARYLYEEHLLDKYFGIIDFAHDNFVYDDINDQFYYIDHEGVGFTTDQAKESYERYFGNYLRKYWDEV